MNFYFVRVFACEFYVSPASVVPGHRLLRVGEDPLRRVAQPHQVLDHELLEDRRPAHHVQRLLACRVQVVHHVLRLQDAHTLRPPRGRAVQRDVRREERSRLLRHQLRRLREGQVRALLCSVDKADAGLVRVAGLNVHSLHEGSDDLHHRRDAGSARDQVDLLHRPSLVLEAPVLVHTQLQEADDGAALVVLPAEDLDAAAVLRARHGREVPLQRLAVQLALHREELAQEHARALQSAVQVEAVAARVQPELVVRVLALAQHQRRPLVLHDARRELLVDGACTVAAHTAHDHALQQRVASESVRPVHTARALARRKQTLYGLPLAELRAADDGLLHLARGRNLKAAHAVVDRRGDGRHHVALLLAVLRQHGAREHLLARVAAHPFRHRRVVRRKRRAQRLLRAANEVSQLRQAARRPEQAHLVLVEAQKRQAERLLHPLVQHTVRELQVGARVRLPLFEDRRRHD
eukprot:Rhum_TRINITY_DN15333_c0_g2::Rhum_TRINITY_DN15333_c0_g2_i1::g.152370::m.152370